MEVIGFNKVIVYNTNYYMRINMAKKTNKHHCSVNNRNILSPIVATNSINNFNFFSFFKMYIQNAAQWYNLNSILCKQISMIRKKKKKKM